MALRLRRRSSIPLSIKYLMIFAAIGVAGIICATMPEEISKSADDADADWWKKILGKLFHLFPDHLRSGAIRTLGIVLILGSCGGGLAVFQSRHEIDAEAAGLNVDLSETGQRDYVMSILFANQDRNNPYFLAKGTGPAPDEVLVIHPGTGKSFTFHVKPLLAEDMWPGSAIDRIITAALSKLGQVPAGVQPVVTPPPPPNFDEWGRGRFGFDDAVASEDFEDEEMEGEWTEEDGEAAPGGAVAGQAPGGMSPEEITRMVEAAAAAKLAQEAAGGASAGAAPGAASPVSAAGASGGDPFASGSRGGSSDPFAGGSKSASDPFASGTSGSPAPAPATSAATSGTGAMQGASKGDPFASSGTAASSSSSGASTGASGTPSGGSGGAASGSTSGTAAADSLLAKARAKWDEQAYEASILLAEKALELYREQLPEGHATLAKVEAMIEAAEQKAKEQAKK